MFDNVESIEKTGMATDSMELITRIQFLTTIGGIAGDPVLSRFFDSGEVVRIPAGDFVFQKDDACDNYLIVLDGVVRVQLSTEAGREVTLYRVRPGGSCALTTSCLIGNECYPAEAVTESPVVAILLPNAEFQTVLDDSRQFRRFVFDGFAARLTAIIGQIHRNAFSAIDERLASVLLDSSNDGISLVTHQYLAAELGTAREVISRKLKQFEAQGLVRLGRGRINIVDQQGLLSLVSP